MHFFNRHAASMRLVGEQHNGLGAAASPGVPSSMSSSTESSSADAAKLLLTTQRNDEAEIEKKKSKR
jgi:hypothetical protein